MHRPRLKYRACSGVDGGKGWDRHAGLPTLWAETGCDIEALKTQLRQQAGAAEVRFFGQEVAHKSDKRNRLVKAFLKAIRTGGGHPAFKVKTGTSDMNVVAPHWQCPVVAYGPGDSAFDHTPQEQISLREYGQAIDVLEQTLLQLTA